MSMPVVTRASPQRHHRWALLFPFVWQAGLAPWVNDVAYRPFGLPFPMAWQMIGIVATSVVIGWVFSRDAEAAVGRGVGSSNTPRPEEHR